MKKYYKLKKDLPTFRAGNVFVLEGDGCLYWDKDTGESNHWRSRVMAYHAKTLARFPNILDEWFEEMPADFGNIRQQATKAVRSALAKLGRALAEEYGDEEIE